MDVEIRAAAIKRIKAGRKKLQSLQQVAAGANVMETVIRAASEGAMIGQLARALGFGKGICEIAPVETRVLC